MGKWHLEGVVIVGYFPVCLHPLYKQRNCQVNPYNPPPDADFFALSREGFGERRGKLGCSVLQRPSGQCFRAVPGGSNSGGWTERRGKGEAGCCGEITSM